jgi:hypothetical protein
MDEKPPLYICPPSPKFDNAIDALKHSIQKWETIVQKLKEGYKIQDYDSRSCALCKTFIMCVNCPVCLKTGRTDCELTPYGIFSWNDTSIEKAQDEVDFLKSLLPSLEPKIYSCPEAPTFDNDKEALLHSINKWKIIAEKIKEGYEIKNLSIFSCALCKRYNSVNVSPYCCACPVENKFCDGTPYETFNHNRTYENAIAEVNFLQSIYDKLYDPLIITLNKKIRAIFPDTTVLVSHDKITIVLFHEHIKQDKLEQLLDEVNKADYTLTLTSSGSLIIEPKTESK